MDIWGRWLQAEEWRGPRLWGGGVVRLRESWGAWGWRVCVLGVQGLRAAVMALAVRGDAMTLKGHLLQSTCVGRALSQGLGTREWEGRHGSPLEPRGMFFQRAPGP